METRQEFLSKCKQRALAYVEIGDYPQAYTSMASDLMKRDDTKDHCGIDIGLQLLMIGALSDAASMRRFIEGFN